MHLNLRVTLTNTHTWSYCIVFHYLVDKISVWTILHLPNVSILHAWSCKYWNHLAPSYCLMAVILQQWCHFLGPHRVQYFLLTRGGKSVATINHSKYLNAHIMFKACSNSINTLWFMSINIGITFQFPAWIYPILDSHYSICSLFPSHDVV